MLEYPIPFINLEFLYYKAYQLIIFIFSAHSVVWLQNVSIVLFPFSVVLSLLFTVGIVYCFIRIREIEHSLIEGHEVEGHKPPADMPNKRWVRIVNHLNSDNESDWRLAILEADLILEEMLEKMGYPGETIGDKLRGIEKSDFTTINEARGAHRVRNMIAHEGGNFRISNRDARLVVSLYEKVFKEFHFINS